MYQYCVVFFIHKNRWQKCHPNFTFYNNKVNFYLKSIRLISSPKVMTVYDIVSDISSVWDSLLSHRCIPLHFVLQSNSVIVVFIFSMNICMHVDKYSTFFVSFLISIFLLLVSAIFCDFLGFLFWDCFVMCSIKFVEKKGSIKEVMWRHIRAIIYSLTHNLLRHHGSVSSFFWSIRE